MQEVVNPKVRPLYLDDKYGKFSIEPLEPGFGHTLGNAFRRILLAHIPGAAITDVRINGVLHEFSTLPGIAEDSIELMLNIKEISVRALDNFDEDAEYVMRIRANGVGEILAADIDVPNGLEIVNPELHIVELSDEDAELEIDMWVEAGKGYVLAEERERGKRGIDVLPIDSIFSPIKRAAYRVESTRLGSRTNLDKLILELWGDGTIAPEKALGIAARELWRYVRIFEEVTKEVPREESLPTEEEPVVEKNHDVPIEDVDFSVRTFNCLKKENINSLGELVHHTEEELLGIRNFGKRSLEEVIQRLENYNLNLADMGDK